MIPLNQEYNQAPHLIPFSIKVSSQSLTISTMFPSSLSSNIPSSSAHIEIQIDCPWDFSMVLPKAPLLLVDLGVFFICIAPILSHFLPILAPPQTTWLKFSSLYTLILLAISKNVCTIHIYGD